MSGVLSGDQRRALARMLDEDGIGNAPQRVTRRTGDRTRAVASFGQDRLYFVEQLYPASPIYLVSGALRLRGRLDTEALDRSIRYLVERHETLRTTFEETAEGLIQLVHDADTVHFDIPVIEVDATEVQRTCADIGRRGFDLTAPLLFRAVLLRVRDTSRSEWVLVLAMHHIVVDGWSLSILMAELAVAYRAFVAGGVPQLSEPPVQYADFAVWQRQRLSDRVLTEQVGFWRTRLASLPRSDVPVDRSRPARRDYSGETIPITVPRTAIDALRRIAEGCRATLFMVLAAAVAVVLGRWANEHDVLIGTPFAGRQRAELEGVVGFFVNTLPLRIKLASDDSFRMLVRRAREVCTEAYAHQDVPFEHLVREFGADRDVSGQSSLARHWLVLHNTPRLDLELPDLECAIEPGLVSTVRCDLSFQLVPDRSGGLTGWLEYSTELYEKSTAERLVTALECIILAAGKYPDQPLSTLPVLPAATRHWIYHDLSRGPCTTSLGRGVGELFELQVDRTPEGVAIIDDETGSTMSYEDLDVRANKIGHLLRQCGVGPEDRVGVLLERGAEVLAALLGILKVGAVYLPLDQSLPRQRLFRMVADGAPRLVLTTVDQVEAADGLDIPTMTLDQLDHQADHRLDPIPFDKERAAFALFTSGTTGQPKGVVGTVGGLVNRLLGMRDTFGVDHDDRVLQKAPFGFDVSLWELLLPVLSGAAVVCSRTGGNRDVDYLRAAIERQQVSICHFVPSMLQMFAKGAMYPTLRVLLSGGETLPSAVAERVLTANPRIRLYNQYGPTEATIDVSSGELRLPVTPNVPIGRPVPGAEVYILNEHMEIQPVGVPGQVYLGGVQLARGYVGASRLTAERFVPDPRSVGNRLYATGDRARWLPDGTIEFIGRLDRQAKIRGVRVEPAEIEAVLVRHPQVVDALVMPVDGELVGYVTASGPVASVELYELLRTWLARPMVPTHLVALDQWPVGSQGKIDISALPRPAVEPVAQGGALVAPRTETEQAIADIFSELLARDQIGINDSFLELGGHSILVIRAISRIRGTLGVGLTVSQFFTAPTVAALGRLVDESKHRPAISPIRRIDHARREA